MWRTVTGPRSLSGSEATLVRRAVDEMSRAFVEELNCDRVDPPSESARLILGIDWFDQWEPAQKLWLLDHVTTALLSQSECPPQAAMFEATVDAIYCHIVERIEREIDTGMINEGQSWRWQVVKAFRAISPSANTLDPHGDNVTIWRQTVTKIADSLLGIAAYQQAEQYRDASRELLQRFLTQKGLPSDFLERIPPMQKEDAGRKSYLRIQHLVSHHES